MLNSACETLPKLRCLLGRLPVVLGARHRHRRSNPGLGWALMHAAATVPLHDLQVEARLQALGRPPVGQGDGVGIGAWPEASILAVLLLALRRQRQLLPPCLYPLVTAVLNQWPDNVREVARLSTSCSQELSEPSPALFGCRG